MCSGGPFLSFRHCKAWSSRQVRMSLRGGGPRGVGNIVIPIIPLNSLSFPKVPQGSLVPSPRTNPPLGSYKQMLQALSGMCFNLSIIHKIDRGMPSFSWLYVGAGRDYRDYRDCGCEELALEAVSSPSCW